MRLGPVPYFCPHFHTLHLPPCLYPCLYPCLSPAPHDPYWFWRVYVSHLSHPRAISQCTNWDCNLRRSVISQAIHPPVPSPICRHVGRKINRESLFWILTGFGSIHSTSNKQKQKQRQKQKPLSIIYFHSFRSPSPSTLALSFFFFCKYMTTFRFSFFFER